MRQSSWLSVLATAVVFTALAHFSAPIEAQEQSIVSNQVEVSANHAALLLEFSDGKRTRLSFEDGVVTIDGEALGDYDPDGAANHEWRGLLADVLSLTNGDLARALEAWRPEAQGDSEEANLLRRIDQALEDAVSQAARSGRQAEDGGRNENSLVSILRLLGRFDELEGLAALGNLELGSIEILQDEQNVVADGESIDGTLLIANGDVSIRGHVRGDVIVLLGEAILHEGGQIDGDVRVIEGSFDNEGGELQGEVVDIERTLRREQARQRREFRDEIRDELRGEFGREGRERSRGAFSRVTRGVGDLFETLFLFLVLGGLTLLIDRFGRGRRAVIEEAVRANPARSAVVGFAGGFMIVPVYILGILILVVSIVGIPALLLWIPVYPMAVALGGLTGYLAVGRFVGEWLLDQEFQWLDRLSRNNDMHVRLAGLGALLLPFAAASLIQVLPLVGWLGRVVQALGCLVFFVTSAIGFGAVLITRGGRLRDFPGGYGMGDWASSEAPFSFLDDEDLGVEDVTDDQAEHTDADKTDTGNPDDGNIDAGGGDVEPKSDAGDVS